MCIQCVYSQEKICVSVRGQSLWNSLSVELTKYPNINNLKKSLLGD